MDADLEDVSLTPVGPPGLPGTSGGSGEKGDTGPAGINAFTALTSPFVMPTSNHHADIYVGNTEWMSVGQALFIESAGYLLVESITSSTLLNVRGLELTGNAAAGTTIAAGKKVSPGGYAYMDTTALQSIEERVSILESTPTGTDTYVGSSSPAGADSKIGDIWFDSDDGFKMYRWDGTGWQPVSKVLELADFGTGLRPIQTLSSLPATGTVGQFVLLTTDKKLYRWNGSQWTKAVATDDLVGEINGAMVVDGTLVAQKFAANSVTADAVGSNRIITLSANIGDEVVENSHIKNLAVGKLTTGDIETAAITLKGAGAVLKSTNYISGSSGFFLDGTGAFECNNAKIRGELIAGKVTAGQISTDSVCFNRENPGLTFPLFCTSNGFINYTPTSNAAPSWTTFSTLQGWKTGSGFVENRFGKSRVTFIVSAAFGYTFTGGLSNAPLAGIAYRVNGGSWTDCVDMQPAYNGFVSGSRSFTLTLQGTDTIEFGVHVEPKSSSPSVGYADCSVCWFNL